MGGSEATVVWELEATLENPIRNDAQCWGGGGRFSCPRAYLCSSVWSFRQALSTLLEDIEHNQGIPFNSGKVVSRLCFVEGLAAVLWWES